MELTSCRSEFDKLGKSAFHADRYISQTRNRDAMTFNCLQCERLYFTDFRWILKRAGVDFLDHTIIRNIDHKFTPLANISRRIFYTHLVTTTDTNSEHRRLTRDKREAAEWR